MERERAVLQKQRALQLPKGRHQAATRRSSGPSTRSGSHLLRTLGAPNSTGALKHPLCRLCNVLLCLGQDRWALGAGGNSYRVLEAIAKLGRGAGAAALRGLGPAW